jgi:hypothetical protein
MTFVVRAFDVRTTFVVRAFDVRTTHDERRTTWI